ncbi:MAG: DUF72 domain-containing protein [Candidatus Acidiferrales bacterium]
MDSDSVPDLFMGTSSWSAEGWVGPFYPPGTPPAEFLPAYATHFNSVEIDSTYYRVPSPKMVQGWRDRTPPGDVQLRRIPFLARTISRAPASHAPLYRGGS